MWIIRQCRRFSKSAFRIIFIIILGFLFITAFSVITGYIFQSKPRFSIAPHFVKLDEITIKPHLQSFKNSDLKVDVYNIPPNDSEMRNPLEHVITSNKTRFIDGVKYPLLSSSGNFIPIRRWVHIDMKGAPYKVSYYKEIFSFMKTLGVNGVVLEWEDMFPYTGVLANAVNGNAYTMHEVEEILSAAKLQDFEIVPLVQTFGHLEWILKLEEFAHLRDNVKYPQVICVGMPEAWRLIMDMLGQVGRAHQKFSNLRFYHMGADEVYQMGTCEESATKLNELDGRGRFTLWHITRTAAHLKNIFKVDVLAWHDMLERSTIQELDEFNVSAFVEPVLWSYAEDLEQYLSFTTWQALKPFRKVWASSVYKGADGPMRFSSNPIHYIRNQESWIAQMTRMHAQFEYIQGMIFSGWSRYDHLAILCETFPVAIPCLAMCLETIMRAQPLDGQYNLTYERLSCRLPHEPGFSYGCNFPGYRVYELVNEFYAQHNQLQKYRNSDFEMNGWLSDLTEKYASSSAMYIEKIMPFIDGFLQPMEKLEEELREEMSKIFFADAIEEFMQTYVSADLKFLRNRKTTALKILAKHSFPKRPFVSGINDTKN